MIVLYRKFFLQMNLNKTLSHKNGSYICDLQV